MTEPLEKSRRGQIGNYLVTLVIFSVDDCAPEYIHYHPVQRLFAEEYITFVLNTIFSILLNNIIQINEQTFSPTEMLMRWQQILQYRFLYSKALGTAKSAVSICLAKAPEIYSLRKLFERNSS